MIERVLPRSVWYGAILLALSTVTPYVVRAQTTNLRVADSLLGHASRFLVPQATTAAEISVSLPATNEGIALREAFLREPLAPRLRFVEPRSAGDSAVVVQSVKINVRYGAIADTDDDLVREVEVELFFQAPGLAVESAHRRGGPFTFKDTVARKQIPLLESSELPYTKGIVPENLRPWYAEILEPLAIVAASALTVVLLFTVRTQ